uniref:Uncharacterized protein n=1 Tax=uncultured bacterium W4-87b TaxID=1130995 RepID=H9BWT5_9BACT|nr:hypothetical protein [uncultured bacterium W4-87b]
MNEWASHPIAQSIIAPFIVALIASKLLNRLRLSGLALIAGFCATVYLVADFNFEPLSAIKKIILSGLIAAAIGLLLDLTPNTWRFMRYLIVIACSNVVLWMLWPVLQQKEIQEATIYGIGIVTYVTWMAILMDRLATKPARAGSAGMGLGVGIGISALFSASALLGQLGLAIGVACSAYLLTQLMSGKPFFCGRTFTLPLSLLCGLIAPATMMLAQMPWYCLPVLAAIPLVAHVPLPRNWSLREQIILLSILTLIIGAASILLAWSKAGVIPI